MNAALFSVPVTEKNGSVYNKTLLLNSNKVRNHYRYGTTNYTIFDYVMNGKKITFKAAVTFTVFDALIRETANEETIPMYVTTKGKEFNTQVAVNRVEHFNVDAFGMAYDNADAISATVFIDEGDGSLLRLNVSHTISQINMRASTSYSYSETGI